MPRFPKWLSGSATIKHQSILQIITYWNLLKGMNLTNGLLGPFRPKKTWLMTHSGCPIYYYKDWSLFQPYLTVSLIVLKKASEQHVNEVSRWYKQQETENRRYLEIRNMSKRNYQSIIFRLRKKEKVMHLGWISSKLYFIWLIPIKYTEIYTLNYTKTFFFWFRKFQFVISVIPERVLLSLEECIDRLCKRADK